MGIMLYWLHAGEDKSRPCTMVDKGTIKQPRKYIKEVNFTNVKEDLQCKGLDDGQINLIVRALSSEPVKRPSAKVLAKAFA